MRLLNVFKGGALNLYLSICFNMRYYETNGHDMIVGCPGVTLQPVPFNFDVKYRFCGVLHLSIDFHFFGILKRGACNL